MKVQKLRHSANAMALKQAVALAAVVATCGSFAPAATSLWSAGVVSGNTTSSGNWSSNGAPGWNGTGVPNAIGATASFGTASVATSGNTIGKIIIILSGILFGALLIYSIIFPLLGRRKKSASIQIHPDIPGLINLDVPVYKRIAVALDFSENDAKLLAAAVGQAKQDTRFFLIHVVESATAILLGK